MAPIFQDVNLYCLLPELVLLTGAVVLLFVRGAGRGSAALPVAATTVIVALAAVPLLWGERAVGFGGMIVKDNGALLAQALLLITALVSFAAAADALPERKNNGEYYSLLLFSLVGMGIMTAAGDLLVIFLGMEILALSLYVLVGFLKVVRAGMEGAVKYFLLGSVASAVFLLGLALTYGATGSTQLVAFTAPATMPALLPAAAVLLVVGLGFKIAAPPFHMWAPDVYEGAPISVATYISVAPKIAAFVVLLRLAGESAGPGREALTGAFVFMSVAGMAVGNLAALRQTSLVRMLAYSGIAQAAYILIGLPALSAGGAAAVSFYLLVYMFMNLGAFASLAHLSRRRTGTLRIDDLAGLASRAPGHAFALAVFMIALTGIPPTGGFFAKFYVFKAGIQAGYLGVVLVAVVATVVSCFYYLRVVMVMYGEEGGAGLRGLPAGVTMLGAAIGVMVVMTILTGILPERFLQAASAAFPLLAAGM
ncbi:MAG: NADH-quinone oxidoreductase subunit N [Pseudomonadota bacterium]|nr:NADH-quinone oxidoreductase subunit N [Pseudomonadota bacterium]